MAKIPFDIKYRPQIESGEYKVKTRDGRKARIIHWDLNCTSPIVAVMDAHIDLPGEIVDVFSVSGRAFDDLESPSDLFIVTPEEELSKFEKAVYDCVWGEVTNKSDGETKEEYAKRNAAELLGLARTELTCQGNIVLSIEEFEKCFIEAQERGQKEALKDLPRWKKAAQAFGNYTVAPTETGEYCLLIDGYFIMLSNLEKLPGFKEDEK